jgi:DNA-binding transcriptional ArsR family regulator
MTTPRENPTRVNVLSRLSEGWGIRRIARYLGISHPAVLKHVRILEKNGYITKLFRSSQAQYSVLPLGLELLNSVEKRLPPPEGQNLTEGSKWLPPREEKMQIRVHRLQVKYDLVEPMKDPALIHFVDHPSKIVPLEHWSKNVIEFEDYSIIISTRSMIITGIQRELDTKESVESQYAALMEKISPIAEEAEARIRRTNSHFRLKRLDRGILSGKILSTELAYEHHPIAEKSGPMIIRDKEDNKPRVLVDNSKGFPELETVHKLHAVDDMDLLRRNTESLITYDLNDVVRGMVEQATLDASVQDKLSQITEILLTVTKLVSGGMR